MAEHGTLAQSKRKFSFTNDPVQAYYDYSNTEVL